MWDCEAELSAREWDVGLVAGLLPFNSFLHPLRSSARTASSDLSCTISIISPHQNTGLGRRHES